MSGLALRVLLAVASLWCLCVPNRSEAQTPGRSVHALVGSGLSIGSAGGGNTAMLMSPVTIDAGASFWNSERPALIAGIAGRVELTGRTSLGIVPRLGFHRDFGIVSLRPSVALPVFLSPFSLLGVEGAVTARYALGDRFWAIARVAVAAFFWGSDLPDDSTLIMVNGALGAELQL